MSRYSRQTILPQVGLQGQQRLAAAKVLIVGLGGLGCPVLQYLVAAGVGSIHLIDADVVELSNLQRQVLFGEKDLGQLKVVLARQRLQALNSDCDIHLTAEFLQHDNVEAQLSCVDIVVDCSDDLASKYLLNDYAYWLKKPLITASLSGFKAQIAHYRVPQTPCMRCLFPAASQMALPSCESAGILGAVAGTVGSLQALEVIKAIVSQGNDVSRDWLSIDLGSYAVQRYAMRKDPNCELCGQQKKQGLVYPERLKLPAMTWCEFKQHPQREQITLIDVREAEENQRQNLGGVNIPLAELPEKLDYFDKKKLYLIYCQSGQRSQKAVSFLLNQGVSEVFYLVAGMAAE